MSKNISQVREHFNDLVKKIYREYIIEISKMTNDVCQNSQTILVLQSFIIDDIRNAKT